ncbi:LysM peptidoglycan-binding domain-containing protein [Bacteroidota bacterium]
METMNKIIRYTASILVLLFIISGCKSTKSATDFKVKEGSYIDPYSGKLDSELSVSESYIKTHRDLAINEMKRAEIPASITLAQGILESGNGNSYLAKKANNHFGIKCGSNWQGESIYFDDDQANECFRKYTSVVQSFQDHSDFLVNSDRYKSLFDLDITDYKAWATGLKKAGYATRRNYAELLIELIEKHNLTIYDIEIPKSDNQKVAKQADEQFKYNGIQAILAKDGDTYNEIAKRNAISIVKLLDYNDLTEPRYLKPGQVVYMGPKKTVAKESYHIVKGEDRMYSISQEYGIKMESLYQKNLLNPGEEAAVGEILYLRQKRSEPAETRVVVDEPVIVDTEQVAETFKNLDSDNTSIVENEEPVKNSEVSVKPVFATESTKENTTESNESTTKVVFEDEPEFEEVPSKSEQNVSTTVAGTKTETISQPKIKHKVEAGETLYALSRKYGVSVDQIKKWNNMSSNELRVGEQIIVEEPKTVEVVVAKNNETQETKLGNNTGSNTEKPSGSYNPDNDTLFHIAKDDESFYSISRKYNMTIIDLIAINKLKENKVIPGQKLIIKLPKNPVKTASSTSEYDFFIDKPKPAESTETSSASKTTTTNSSESQVHIVKAGETLYAISRLYNVSVEEIKKRNNLSTTSLYVGQKLIIGKKVATATTGKTPQAEISDKQYHTVAAGETLYKISVTYKISVDEIKKLNNLSSNNLSIGQKLRVK